MARRVFDGAKADKGEEPQATAGTARRSPLVKGGAAAPKYIQGSTRAVSERTHEDIPVDQIQDSLIEDRIDVTEDLEELTASIGKHGQQIPIIVRIVNDTKPYEIIAGRRRLAAIQHLGHKTIRGFITRMSDKEAFVAQGLENSARLETSFIERARTVVKAYEAGFEQAEVGEFLGVSQAMISYMTRIYNWLGDQLVIVIGPARGIGRRKWESLINTAKSKNMTPADLQALVDANVEDSADRFETLLTAAQSGRAPHPNRSVQRASPSERQDLLDGRYTATRKSRQLVIQANARAPENLLDFISKRLPALIEEFEAEESAGS